MKKKITYITILAVAVVTAFFIGKANGRAYSKYDYLNLNEIVCTEIDGEAIRIHTTEDSYLIFGVCR